MEAGAEVREIEGMSSVAIVARLYQGAIDFVGRAQSAADAVERRRWLGRAVAVVDALQDHLDVEAGGELAGNLSDLYDFVRGRLVVAEQGGPEPIFDTACREAVGVLDRVRLGWEQLALAPAESA